jgi:hypothetical protein
MKSFRFTNTKPVSGARIDWGSPLTRGLVALYVCDEAGGQIRNLVNERQVGALGTWAPHRGGLTVENFSGTIGGVPELNFASGAWTVGVFGEVANVTGSEQPALFGRSVYVDESNNQGWELGGASTGVWRFVAFNNNGFASYNLLGTGSRANGPVSLFGTTDGTTRRLYVNGLVEASTNNNASIASASSGLYNSPGATEHQLLYIGYAWNRCLSAAEVLELSRNPYALLTTKALPDVSSAVSVRASLLPLLGVGRGMQVMLVL